MPKKLSRNDLRDPRARAVHDDGRYFCPTCNDYMGQSDVIVEEKQVGMTIGDIFASIFSGDEHFTVQQVAYCRECKSKTARVN